MSTSAFCAADCTAANCRPAAWQAASAAAHERESLLSVYVHDGGSVEQIFQPEPVMDLSEDQDIDEAATPLGPVEPLY